MKVENLQEPSKMKLMVYGDSGTGKTTLIGSAMNCPDAAPLLVLNAMGQPVTLRQFDPPPLVLTIEDIKDFNGIYTWLYRSQPIRGVNGNKRQLITEGLIGAEISDVISKYLNYVDANAFGTVGVDSATHVQRIALDAIVGRVAGPADIPPQTKIQQWGRTLALMTNLSDWYFKLDMHVMMTALARRDIVDALNTTMFCPFLWGQSSLEVPSHAEIVGRLMCIDTINPTERTHLEEIYKKRGMDVPFNVLYTSGGRDFMAKWQGVPNPPKILPNPTVAKILSVMSRADNTNTKGE